MRLNADLNSLLEEQGAVAAPGVQLPWTELGSGGGPPPPVFRAFDMRPKGRL